MATVIFIKESKQTPSAMRGCINYCVQEKKTVDENGRQYVGGVNCLGQHAYEEFMATKNLYGKASGTYFYQYVQSFAPGEIQSYEEAHRIGLEFAGKSFPGYEVLVATHLDAHDDRGVQRVHNHFIVNSVSFKDGKKIHFTPNTLQELRKISDDTMICGSRRSLATNMPSTVSLAFCLTKTVRILTNTTVRVISNRPQSRTTIWRSIGSAR